MIAQSEAGSSYRFGVCSKWIPSGSLRSQSGWAVHSQRRDSFLGWKMLLLSNGRDRSGRGQGRRDIGIGQARKHRRACEQRWMLCWPFGHVSFHSTQSPTEILHRLDIDEATWDKNLSLNLKSYYLVTRAVLSHMLERKAGVIINVSSVNGLAGLGEQAYAAGKAAVVSLTENLAVRHGGQGIRVNAVAPGSIYTSTWDERLKTHPETLDNLVKYYPLGRIGAPEDM
jgi:hypothetical protein